jgi:hypothetical protein
MDFVIVLWVSNFDKTPRFSLFSILQNLFYAMEENHIVFTTTLIRSHTATKTISPAKIYCGTRIPNPLIKRQEKMCLLSLQRNILSF